MRIIAERTLSEQMQLTEREIEKRQTLFNITGDDIKNMALCKPYIEQRLDSIVEEFYKYQLSIPEIDLLIGDAETLRRLKSAMADYIRDLFGGYYGSEYVNRRLRIGKVHKRIGVAPKLYISTMNVLYEVLASELENFSPTLPTSPGSKSLHRSLHKILMFDVELVFDTYIHSLLAEVETAKAEVENYAETLEETIAERTRQLKELSRKDPVTNLLNQRAFIEELRRELSRAKREEQPLSLAYIDLNGFKAINDEKGHQEGDIILQLVSNALTQGTRESDIPCRYGGDEFCAIFPNCDEKMAVQIFKKVLNLLVVDGSSVVTLSIGLAHAGPKTYPSVEDFIRQSDTAMYAAKEKSREKLGNYIVTSDGLQEDPSDH